MENKYKREFWKPEMGRVYHMELLFDSPIEYLSTFSNMTKKCFKYALKDIDTNIEYTKIFDQDSSVSKNNLIKMKRGDKFDIMLKTFEKSGRQMKTYQIMPLYTTPEPYNPMRHSVRPPENQPNNDGDPGFSPGNEISDVDVSALF